MTIRENIHPSIFYTRLIRRSGRGGAGAYPSGHRAKGGVHPGQVRENMFMLIYQNTEKRYSLYLDSLSQPV